MLAKRLAAREKGERRRKGREGGRKDSYFSQVLFLPSRPSPSPIALGTLRTAQSDGGRGMEKKEKTKKTIMLHFCFLFFPPRPRTEGDSYSPRHALVVLLRLAMAGSPLGRACRRGAVHVV